MCFDGGTLRFIESIVCTANTWHDEVPIETYLTADSKETVDAKNIESQVMRMKNRVTAKVTPVKNVVKRDKVLPSRFKTTKANLTQGKLETNNFDCVFEKCVNIICVQCSRLREV